MTLLRVGWSRNMAWWLAIRIFIHLNELGFQLSNGWWSQMGLTKFHQPIKFGLFKGWEMSCWSMFWPGHVVIVPNFIESEREKKSVHGITIVGTFQNLLLMMIVVCFEVYPIGQWMVQLRPKKIKQKTKPFRMLLQARPIWLTYIFANTIQVSATTVKKKKKAKLQ